MFPVAELKEEVQMANNISQLMKQAQQMQSKLEEIKLLEIDGDSCGGKVSIKINGSKDILELHIDPSLLDDAEMVSDAVIAAFHDASDKLDKKASSMMSSATPAGFKLPF